MFHRDVGSYPGPCRFAYPRTAGISLLLAVLLVACSPTINQHGHRIDNEMIASIVPGVTSKEQVARVLGSPSAIGTFEDQRWYYITQRSEKVSFYQSEITKQDVVVVAFDDRGIVENVDRQGLDQAQAVVPAAERTRTLGKELSLFEQLIGNIGRFSDRDGQVGGN